MSIPLNVNGVVYDYPQVDDVDWGPDATDWASAVTSGMLQKAGGLFQLLAEVDFGTAFGIKSLYYKSRTSNPASAGQIRLARADVINWRNQANDNDLSLGVSSSNILQFNGVNIQNSLAVTDTTTIDLTLSSDTLSADIIAGSITNSLISASAAIAFSKLAALTSAHILVGSAGNVATDVAVTGDITISNAGVTAIGANKVVNSMLAQMAQSTFKGRAASAGTGDPVDLTAAQATAILNAFVGDSGSGGTKGLVPAPTTGDATKFLGGNGVWGTPTGAGDVVGPGSSTDNGFAKFDGTTGKLIKNSAATISNSDVNASAAIAFSKLAALTSAHILVGSAGNVATDVAVTGDMSLTNAGVTAYSGTVPLNKGGTGQTTKAPAFDALSPMTTGGDLIYGGASGTGTRLANGSAIQLLSSAGSTSAPAWAWPGIFAKRSVTTTDSPTNADNVLYLSGNSFVVTLFDAVANPGKVIMLLHSGTSLTQVYTLNTTSSQTIGGIASGSYALYTAGECLILISDGANWLILGHHTITTPVAYTPTFTGFGTVTAIDFRWCRNGAFFQAFGKATTGTVTGVEARVSFPTSMPNSSAGISTVCVAGPFVRTTALSGSAYVLIEPSVAYFTFSLAGGASSGIAKALGNGMVANNDVISFNATVPILGLQP